VDAAGSLQLNTFNAERDDDIIKVVNSLFGSTQFNFLALADGACFSIYF